jgi:enoyl-CoA hydratase
MKGMVTPHTWTRDGDIGILSLGASPGNYLADPEFIPVHQANGYFSEPGLKGVIIRGSGRHFSAGADMDSLRKLAMDEMLLAEKLTAGKELIRILDGLHLPVVAEIRGACLGGGLEIALACHIRICSDNALFAFPEANHGILPGLGGTATLSRLIGPGQAAVMILSGDVVNAERALVTGLVDYVVPKDKLQQFTEKYLLKLTEDRDVHVIRSVMASIQNSIHMPLEEAMLEETKLFCSLAARNMKS